MKNQEFKLFFFIKILFFRKPALPSEVSAPFTALRRERLGNHADHVDGDHDHDEDGDDDGNEDDGASYLYCLFSFPTYISG